MIRINLLPYRASKKKETATQQIMIMSVVMLLALAIIAGVYLVTLNKISTTKQEITQSEEELANLKKKVGEIDKLKKLQAEVQRKLDILNQLRKEKTGPATRLARMSDIVPEKMWLTRYQESGLKVSISGLAYNEELIADFMRSIQASDEFGTVELLVSEQQEISGVKLKKFDLSCMIKVSMPEAPKTDAVKK
ncbi:MAG: fimbrial protein [Deltaproteobacteria bacterium HGW-Deltaproteobacteria-23]|nr:MAG: fimbrial protein [Deltaproteobacteria bacterium HGW-Deltaproteobacteria-23]